MVSINHFKKSFLLFILTFGISLNAYSAYNVVDRYVLLEDKFKTDEMLRPMGHDFIIDISAWVNADLQDLIKDASDAGKNGTSTEKLAAATALLNKYNNTEQTLRVGVNFGIPIFSFTAFGVKLVPDLRIGVNLGVNLKIGSEVCTFATLSSIVDSQGLDSTEAASIKNALANVSCSIIQGSQNNGNLVSAAINNGGLTRTAALTALETSNKLTIPTNVSVSDLPTLDIYGKGEGKGQLLVNFTKDENISGYVGLGVLGRADIQGKITSSAIANGADIVDLGEEMNTTMALTTDMRLTYSEEDYEVYGQIDDLKLATLSDNKAKGGELIYKIDPLFRAHGTYKLKFVGFNLNPFAGVHKRSRYDFTEGLYAGSDLSFYVWGDRLGIRLRAMVDQEHITLSPLLKLWLMQLDYGLKLPAKSTVDGIKVATLHSLNFRLFF